MTPVLAALLLPAAWDENGGSELFSPGQIHILATNCKSSHGFSYPAVANRVAVHPVVVVVKSHVVRLPSRETFGTSRRGNILLSLCVIGELCGRVLPLKISKKNKNLLGLSAATKCLKVAHVHARLEAWFCKYELNCFQPFFHLRPWLVNPSSIDYILNGPPFRFFIRNRDQSFLSIDMGLKSEMAIPA